MNNTAQNRTEIWTPQNCAKICLATSHSAAAYPRSLFRSAVTALTSRTTTRDLRVDLPSWMHASCTPGKGAKLNRRSIEADESSQSVIEQFLSWFCSCVCRCIGVRGVVATGASGWNGNGKRDRQGGLGLGRAQGFCCL